MVIIGLSGGVGNQLRGVLKSTEHRGPQGVLKSTEQGCLTLTLTLALTLTLYS